MIFGGIALLILVLGVIVYSLVPRASLKLSVAPGEVQLSINNATKESVKNGTVLHIKPGEYTFTVSRDEFDSYTTKQTIKNGQAAELLVALTPLTSAAKQLLADDASQAIVQRFHGKIITAQVDQLTKAYPILSVLPLQERLYSIDSCPSQKYPNDTTKIALCVTETDSSVNEYALAAIRQKGFNPDDYEVIFLIQNATQSEYDAD